MHEFKLHPQLAADTLALGTLPLCEVRLMNERRYPWIILVPKRAGLEEVLDLGGKDSLQLLDEITRIAQRLKEKLQPAKLNIASLGNLVPQLHVHLVARYQNDLAWPSPVWGKFPREPYPKELVIDLLARLDLETLKGFKAIGTG